MIILCDPKITQLMWPTSHVLQQQRHLSVLQLPQSLGSLFPSITTDYGRLDALHQVSQRSVTPCDNTSVFGVKIQFPGIGPTFRVHTVLAWRFGFFGWHGRCSSLRRAVEAVQGPGLVVPSRSEQFAGQAGEQPGCWPPASKRWSRWPYRCRRTPDAEFPVFSLSSD